MGATVSISPFRCRMWSMHYRMDTLVSEETCRVEIESFKKHGQLVPVLGRRLAGDESHDIELIYGARRLFVARHLNQPLTVELRSLSDRDALIAMDMENRHRKDISAYERGVSYAEWLRVGHFESQEDIARAFNVSASQVSRLLKLARLPSVVISAFASPLDICESWGIGLSEALEDEARRSATLRRARGLCAQTNRPASQVVYQELMTAASASKKLRRRMRDEVVKDESGAPLLRVRRQRNYIALLLPAARISDQSLQQIVAGAVRALRDANSEIVDLERRITFDRSVNGGDGDTARPLGFESTGLLVRSN